MRVILVSRIFEPEAAAASFRLGALMRAVVARGDSVRVITTTVPRALRGTEERPPQGASISRWPVLRDRSGYLRGYLQYMSFDVPAFVRVLFARRADVVVVEPPPTTGLMVRLACALRRIPYVYYAADVWSDAAASTNAPGIVVAVVRWIERRALRGAGHVVAVTDGVAERVRALAPRASVQVAPNGIDTRVFRVDGDVIPGTPEGVYAGTTSEWQGADVFIRALPIVRAQLPDARIAFLGQGSAWGQLRALAERTAPGAVVFHGPVPPVEAARWLRSARAGLVSLKPGQGYDFAVPTKIFAAAATGTPVVFSGTGPSRRVIDDAALGVAVDDDVENVAQAMIAAFRSEPTDEQRRDRADWVVANASNSAQASTVADAAAALARKGRR